MGSATKRGLPFLERGNVGGVESCAIMSNKGTCCVAAGVLKPMSLIAIGVAWEAGDISAEVVMVLQCFPVMKKIVTVRNTHRSCLATLPGRPI